MEFMTLGMLIIDDIFYPIPRLPAFNVLGGAGSYAVLGARLICGGERAKGVGWTVHEGSDFAEAVKKQIAEWNTSCNFVMTPARLTTRGLNVYRQNEFRDFEFASPKVRIDASTLIKEQVEARSFHFVCSPERCIDLVVRISAKREELRDRDTLTHDKAFFVWEPIPGLCIPNELDNFLEAIRYVDTVSPNLEELGAFFGVSFFTYGTINMDSLLDVCASILFGRSNSLLSCIVVRMGHWGCLVADHLGATMIDPYHQAVGDKFVTHESEQSASRWNKVTDPTGAGNAFLGGFCIGMTVPPDTRFSGIALSTDSQIVMAAICGTVAASFAVEQVGMPVLSTSTVQKGQELWNDDNVRARIEHCAWTKVRRVRINRTWGTFTDRVVAQE